MYIRCASFTLLLLFQNITGVNLVITYGSIVPLGVTINMAYLQPISIKSLILSVTSRGQLSALSRETKSDWQNKIVVLNH